MPVWLIPIVYMVASILCSATLPHIEHAISIQVVRRRRSALVALEKILAGTDRALSVRRYVDHVDALIDRSPLDELDRSSARHEDPQGLGLTR